MIRGPLQCSDASIRIRAGLLPSASIIDLAQRENISSKVRNTSSKRSVSSVGESRGLDITELLHYEYLHC
jgi:hypothetical protein